MFRPYIPWLIVFALTAVSGAAAGVLGNRWGTPPDLRAAAVRLDRLPADLGEWRLIDESPLDESLVEMLQCIGSTNRTYHNRRSGETVHMSLIVGPPGPTSVHTPEICFSSQGYHVVAAAERRAYAGASSEPSAQTESPAATNEFRKTAFAPDQGPPALLIAYYGWCDGRAWLAPERPRFAFGGLPYLYKMQLAAKIVRRTDEDGDPCDAFLRELLPELARTGFYDPEQLSRARRAPRPSSSSAAESVSNQD
ncbi:MAG TPA: exosortase-associated EpsI family protein [Pirellulales bacterium]|nr:exosortase-associated EpsI family protein [Pirellulales bacterium]